MVSSTEIPKAMLKTKMVDGFMGIPKYPINQDVIKSGKMLGIKEIKIILKERNKYAIKMEINKIANSKDIAKFLTK